MFVCRKMEIEDVETMFRELWMENASAISRQNSGAPAMRLSYYKKNKNAFLVGHLRDARVGIQRYLNAIFLDNYYQVNSVLIFRTVWTCISSI